jgi:hypothetical protein
MRIETNTQQAITGRTAARKTGTEGTGPGADKGDVTDATLPRSRLVSSNTLPVELTGNPHRTASGMFQNRKDGKTCQP